jgi:uncharacterized protein with HEPN domain
MAEMRNILIHEYHAVAPEIVWATVLNDLPPLSAMLRDVLKKEG